MRKKYLSRLGSLSLLFMASWSVLILSCQSAPTRRAVEELAREKLGVSVLAVNLYDIFNFPDTRNGASWQTRYTRIFTWMKNTQTFPDIIALQEAPGFWSCPTDGRRLPDYAGLDFLLDGIRDASGEQYRIAYLIAGKPGGTRGNAWIGTAPGQFCSQQGGRALLYRPSRVKNVIIRPGAGDTVISPYVNPFPLRTTYLARSVQCCSPAADRADVCRVIDGPQDTPLSGHFEATMGTCPTPLGVAWTRSRKSMQGENPDKPMADAVFSRFELISEPGNYIHIYNVHRGWGVEPDMSGHRNIDQLVTDIERRFNSPGNPTLYPPILVGDFNIGSEAAPPTAEELKLFFPRFEVGAWSTEVMGVLFGNASLFPAKQKAFANRSEIMPPTVVGETCYRDQNTLWSDHCGFFFRVEPSKR